MSDPELLKDVRRWLCYAGEDLELAESLFTRREGRLRHVCWLCQQSIEKAVKAALFFENIEAPRIHNLDQLVTMLPTGWQLKMQELDLSQLTVWAVQSRYPGEWPEATDADAKAAVTLARKVYESIWHDMRQRGLQ